MTYFTAQNEFSPTDTITCACPNEVLIFNCTVVGGSATVWSGSAFTCAGGEIILLHSDFPSGTSGECSDAITAYSNGPRVESECYTSQLRVNVSSEMNNKTITCSGSGIVGETFLLVTSIGR